MTKCPDKYKQTSSAYDIKGEENTLSTSKKKLKARDSDVCIYEYGKLFCTSTFKCACAAQEETISKMIEIMNMYKSEI